MFHRGVMVGGMVVMVHVKCTYLLTIGHPPPPLQTRTNLLPNHNAQRVFHRMDELLEGAATELRRSKGMLPEEGGDVAGTRGVAGGLEEGKEGGDGEGKGNRDGDSSGKDSEGYGEAGEWEGDGGAKEEGGQGERREEASVERCREILRELAEFRRVLLCRVPCMVCRVSCAVFLVVWSFALPRVEHFSCRPCFGLPSCTHLMVWRVC